MVVSEILTFKIIKNSEFHSLSLVYLQMKMSCTLLFTNFSGFNVNVLGFSSKFYRLKFFFFIKAILVGLCTYSQGSQKSCPYFLK